MKHTNQHGQHCDLLTRLSGMPRKILMMHEHDAVAPAVLHELCHGACFDFAKAAYFVDNPDFNMVRGIAGITRQEMHEDVEHPWKCPEDFCSQMEGADFNNQVRQFHCTSGYGNQQKEQDLVKKIAQELHIEHPEYRTWPMKHHNHGILIFEKTETPHWNEDHLLNGLCLLGLCPIA